MNNFYEKVVLLLPTLTEEEVQEAVKKISSLIVENGGEILKVDNWGKKKSLHINLIDKLWDIMFYFFSKLQLCQ